MNILKKTTAVLFLLPVIALTGCNGLQNEKEVKIAEYTVAAAKTIGTNEYASAHAHSKLNEDGQITESNVDFTWDTNKKEWKSSIAGFVIDLNHAAQGPLIIAAAFAAAQIEPTVHYYVADNGFRIHAKGEVTATGGSAKLEVEYIFNQYGYVTKSSSKGEAEMITSSGTKYTSSVGELSVSYEGSIK